MTHWMNAEFEKVANNWLSQTKSRFQEAMNCAPDSRFPEGWSKQCTFPATILTNLVCQSFYYNSVISENGMSVSFVVLLCILFNMHEAEDLLIYLYIMLNAFIIL